MLTSALWVINTELPTALSSHNFLQRAHWPFAYVSLKFRTRSSPSLPHGPQRAAGTSLGSQREGTSGHGTALTAPNLPLADSRLFTRQAIFLEFYNRGTRVFPEISTLNDPTLSPSNETQSNFHWQGLGICPLTLVSPPFYSFSRAELSLLRTDSTVHPAVHSVGQCFSFLMHICLMDGMTGNYSWGRDNQIT